MTALRWIPIVLMAAIGMLILLVGANACAVGDLVIGLLTSQLGVLFFILAGIGRIEQVIAARPGK